MRVNGPLDARWTLSPKAAFPPWLWRWSLGLPHLPGQGSNQQNSQPCCKGNKAGGGGRAPLPPPGAQSHPGKKPRSRYLAQFTAAASIVINLNKGRNLSPTRCFCHQPGQAWKRTSLFTTSAVCSFPERQQRRPCLLMGVLLVPLARALCIHHGSNVPGPLYSVLIPSQQARQEQFGHKQAACKVPEVCRLINTGPTVGCFSGSRHPLASSASLTHGSSTLGKIK